MNENESVMDEAKVYEISYILDNRLDESKAAEKAEAFKKDIASLEGSFISEETPYMRELSYEMTRVVNNVNVRFNEGYFGWVKFEMIPTRVEELNKKLKLDEEVVRFLVLKTEKGNDILTRDIPVMKSDPTILSSFTKEEAEVLVEEVDIDTTKEDLDSEIPEEIKKELDSEIENIDK
jgi:ribosomal protein S6